MSLRTFTTFVLLGIVLGAGLLAGCKSKETTSAIIHNSTGRYDLAVEQANLALEKNPKDAEAHFQLGFAYSKMDSVGLAFEHFKQSALLDRSPKRHEMVRDNIQSNFARHFNAALKIDDPVEKAKEFEKAVAADPRQESGYFNLGRAYETLGDIEDPAYYDKAVDAYQKCIERATPGDKHYNQALAHTGEVFAKAGKPEEAVEQFARLIEEDPEQYDVIERIGYDRLNREDWRGAAVFLDLAAQARAKINAEDFDLYYNLGVSNFNLGKDDPKYLSKAVDYYTKALELTPGEPSTTYNIQAAYTLGKDWEQAVVWGERYVGLNPHDDKGWLLLSRAYSELGDTEKARQCSNRYAELRGGR